MMRRLKNILHSIAQSTTLAISIKILKVVWTILEIIFVISFEILTTSIKIIFAVVFLSFLFN
jgi:hypothetical protein